MVAAKPKTRDKPIVSNRADEQNNALDVQRWRALDLEKRRLLASLMMRDIKTKVMYASTDPFLTDRLFNRLMNGTETPEGLGFKFMAGDYRLVNPEFVQGL